MSDEYGKFFKEKHFASHALNGFFLLPLSLSVSTPFMELRREFANTKIHLTLRNHGEKTLRSLRRSFSFWLLFLHPSWHD
jgi:hypothetical protein